MSQMETELPDPFFSGLTWGQGKWPSYLLASYVQVGILLYGAEFPNTIGLRSLYGHAFRYADLTQNDGRYTGKLLFEPVLEGANKYIDDVLTGRAKPLDFVVYIPPGYGNVGALSVPNVEETSHPDKVFTATFLGGKEIWANRT
jgi:hypothetical protein